MLNNELRCSKNAKKSIMTNIFKETPFNVRQTVLWRYFFDTLGLNLVCSAIELDRSSLILFNELS